MVSMTFGAYTNDMTTNSHVGIPIGVSTLIVANRKFTGMGACAVVVLKRRKMRDCVYGEESIVTI